MGKESKIEWCTSSWNPWHGCHKISAGCKYCYMFRDKARYGQDPNTVVRSADKTFYAPLKWKEPRRIFTCSWSDFFIEEADAWRDEAFAVMALTPQHTYQVLTKRADRMYEYLSGGWMKRVTKAARKTYAELRSPQFVLDPDREIFKPLENVWLGVSAEDRDTYIHRVPYLAMTPGTTKFLSFEPLLGDIGDLMLDGLFEGSYQWAIAGGESGPNARPMHPDWVRSIRDQCQAAGVPFFFKQWGEWALEETWLDLPGVYCPSETVWPDGHIGYGNADKNGGGGENLYRVGKKAAGRLLDGREWNEMPEVANAR